MSELMDQLVDINAVKSELKTKINENGGSISPSTPFKEYPDHIGDSVIVVEEPEIIPYVYERPADWLTLPTLVEGDQKFVGLYAVYENISNYVTFMAKSDYTIDWGDGTVEDYSAGSTCGHKYNYNNALLDGTLSTKGYKQVIITVTPQSGHNLTAIYLNRSFTMFINDSVASPKWLDIKLAGQNISELYIGSETSDIIHDKLEYFEFIGTCNVTTTLYAFGYCFALKEVKFSSIFPIETSRMFFNCTTLRNIIGVDFSNAINVEYLFSGCNSIEKIDNLNFTNATSLKHMFNSCYNLRTVTNLVVNGSKLLNVIGAFNYCKRLETIPYIDTSNVTEGNNLFNGCNSLITIPLLDTSKFESFDNMFGFCYVLKSIPLLDTSNVERMLSTFAECHSLETIPKLNTSKVTTMHSMFSECSSLKSIPLLDTSNVTEIYAMFSNCSSLKSIPLLDTSNVINMSRTFQYCHSLKTIPLLNTSKVTNMDSLFLQCRGLREIPLLDTSNVTNMSGIFNECNTLSSIPPLNTSKVIHFSNAFRSLTGGQFKLPNFDYSSVEQYAWAFYGCRAIYEFEADLPEALNLSYMFYSNSGIRKIRLGSLLKVTNISSLINSCSKLEEIEIDFTGTSLSSVPTFISNAQNIKSVILTNFSIGSVNLGSTNIDRDAAIRLFNSLGTTTGGYTITLTNTPASDTLTAADILIATDKGWTVTV